MVDQNYSRSSHEENFRKVLQNMICNVKWNHWSCELLTSMKLVPYEFLVKSSELACLRTEILNLFRASQPALTNMGHKEAIFLLQLMYLNTRCTSEIPFIPMKRNNPSLQRIQHGIDAATCFLFTRLVTYPNLPETDALVEHVFRFVAFHVKIALCLLYNASRVSLNDRSMLLPTEEEYEKIYTSLRLLINLLGKIIQLGRPVNEELLKGLVKTICPFLFTSGHAIKFESICYLILQTVLKTNFFMENPATGLEMFIAETIYEHLGIVDVTENMSQAESKIVEEQVESFLYILISLLQNKAKYIFSLTEAKFSVEQKTQLFRNSVTKFARSVHEICSRRPAVKYQVHTVLSKLLEMVPKPDRPGAGFLALALGDLLVENFDRSSNPDKVTLALVNLAAILESVRNIERFCHERSDDIEALLERTVKRKDLNLSCSESNASAVCHTLKGFLTHYWKAYRKADIWACLMLHRDEIEKPPSFTQESSISIDGSLLEQYYCSLAFCKWFVMLTGFKKRQNSWFDRIASFLRSRHVDTQNLALRTVGQLVLIYPEWLVCEHGLGFQTLLRDALNETKVDVRLTVIYILSGAILQSKTHHIWRNMGDALLTCLTDPHKDVKEAAVLALRKVCLQNPDRPYVHTALWEILTGLEAEPSYPKVDQAIVDLFRQRWFTSVSTQVKEKGSCICDVLMDKTRDIRRFMEDFEPEKHHSYLRLLFIKLFYPPEGRKSTSEDIRPVSEKFIELWTRNPRLVKGLKYFLCTWAQIAPQMLEQLLVGFFAYLREGYWPILKAEDEEKLLEVWEDDGELLCCILVVMSNIMPGLIMPHPAGADWKQLEDLLVFYVTCEDVAVTEELIQCWQGVVQYATKDFTRVTDLVEQYYRMVTKYVNTVAKEQLAPNIKNKLANFHKTFVRRVVTLGLVGLHFGFEAFDKTEVFRNEFAVASPLSFRLGVSLTRFIEDSYSHFNRKHYDCRLAAVYGLQTLGYLTVRYDEFLFKGFLHNFYKKHLHDEYFRVDLFYRILQNLSFLWRRPMEKTVFRISAVMKCYVAEIKESLVSQVEEIRDEAFKLVSCALLAKINEYEECVPYLVALSSNADLDAEQSVATGGWEPSLPRLAMKWMKRAVTMNKILSYSEAILLTTYKYQCRLQQRKIVSGVRGQKSLLQEFYVSVQGVENKCKFLREALIMWANHRMDLKYLNFIAGALAHLPFSRRGEVEVLTKIAQQQAKKIARKTVEDMNERSINLADMSGDFSTCKETLSGFQASILLMELVKYIEAEYDLPNLRGSAAEDLLRRKFKEFRPAVVINYLKSNGKCNRQLIISCYQECREFI